MKKWSLILALAGASLAAPLHAGPLPDMGGDSSQAVLSPYQERVIGENIMLQIRRDRDFVDDPEVNAYLNGLAYQLASASPDAKPSLEVFLVRDPSINAFALFGGFIGVHSGLLTSSRSESELAAVMSHEIAHVTQKHLARSIERSQQMSPLTLAAMALAVALARSNPQAAEALLVSSQALDIRGQLTFTRDAEREADRVGMQTLQKSGFDPRAMPNFFYRLQRANAGDTAPEYLRTHPVNSERIADSQGRFANWPYKQVADRLDYLLIREKVRAVYGSPKDVAQAYQVRLQEKRTAHEMSDRFGYAYALLESRQADAAAAQVAELRKRWAPHPLVETLDAQIRMAQNKPAEALAVLQAAEKRYHGHPGVFYHYVDLLIRAGQGQEALQLIEQRKRLMSGDIWLHNLQARAYAVLGRRTAQHFALSEYYARIYDLPKAVEQLELARSGGDGDFYLNSIVEAKLGERRAQLESRKALEPKR